MKKSLYLAAITFFVWTGAGVAAEESAVVTEHKINVRGQPSLIGEVVTQLEKGDKVTVLERIVSQNPKPGEPTNWARIKLPANVPVWAFNPFIKDGAVVVSRLNVRSGAGENYSVLGRVPKGTPVKEIRTVDQWTEIEAPADAYAFVDASLIKSGGEAAVASKPTVTPQPEPKPAPGRVATNAPPLVAPEIAKAQSAATIPTPTAEPQPAPPIIAPETKPKTNLIAEATATRPQPAIPTPDSTLAAPQPSVQAAPEVTRILPPPTTNAVATSTPPITEPARTLPQVAQAPAAKSEEPLPKRIVRREGFVRPTKSIQAPTWFELASTDTKKTINYLHDEKLADQGINLKDFRGLKVIVTGEEAIDERWPKVPILIVETIESAP